MTQRQNEAQLFSLMKKRLYTPVVGDILDAMGYTHQFLPPELRPLREEMKLAGRAMPVLMIDVFGPQKKPCAYWGELLTATARVRGAAGAVLDGYHRDTPQVLAQNWPVFSRGAWAQDSSVRTQVVDFRCNIEIGQVTIHNGDLIFGDMDGILVIPSEVEQEVLEQALEKASGEKKVRAAIESGMSATEAFRVFGIL